MSATKFIKVTPKGEKQARIVLATNKAFYLSQGAKVETPTLEEVYEAEPSERPQAQQPATPTAETNNAAEQIAALNKTTEEQANALKEANDTIATLREQLAASETALTESEKVINDLRKELAKANKEK